MDKKFGIALIALIGIGIFALPSTIALFSGQHSFYNIDATGNQVPCVKCHGDVRSELNSNDNGAGSPGPHKNFQCEYCHRAEVGFSSGDDAYAKIVYEDTSVSPATKIAIVTTISNFEASNFPKQIQYTAGDTIDGIMDTVDTLDIYGNQFTQQGLYKVDCPAADPTGCTLGAGVKVYSGVLSDMGLASPGGLYKYSYTSELSTTLGGAQTDKAFDPREISAANIGEFADSLGETGAREVTPGTRYHAASLVSCMECHGGEQFKGAAGYELNTTEPYNHANWVLEDTTKCGNCHYGSPLTPNQGETWLSAGGFGLTNVRNDTGIVEAHDEFVKTTSVNGILRNGTGQDGGYGAANIACVACHTHVAVDINFQKKYKVEFDAIAQNVGGSWVVDNFKANGTVNISIFGNQSGGTWATGNKTFDWDPAVDLYINGNGNKVNGLTNAANDTEAALTATP